MQKYQLNKLYLILGTQCNLNCKHCMGGDPKENISMNMKCIERLIDDVSCINELTLGGYEPTLYIPLMYEIIDTFIDNGVKINHLHICTNAKVFSEELIEFIKYAKQFLTKPEKTALFISDDIFHLNSGFTREQLTETIERYRKANIAKIEINDLRDGVAIVGRAEKLSREELKQYGCIKVLRNDIPEMICFNKNNDYKITSILGMTPNGYIYAADIKAFNALGNNDYSESMGNILQKSFSTIITEYREKIKDVTDFDNVLILPTTLDGTAKELYTTYQITRIRNQCLKAFENNDKSLFDNSIIELNDIDVNADRDNYYTKAKDIKAHYFSIECNKHELEIIKIIADYFSLSDNERLKYHNEYQAEINNIFSEYTQMSEDSLSAYQAWEKWDLGTLQDMDIVDGY